MENFSNDTEANTLVGFSEGGWLILGENQEYAGPYALSELQG